MCARTPCRVLLLAWSFHLCSKLVCANESVTARFEQIIGYEEMSSPLDLGEVKGWIWYDKRRRNIQCRKCATHAQVHLKSCTRQTHARVRYLLILFIMLILFHAM